MHKLNKQAYTNVIQLQLDIVFLFISYFVSYYIASKFTSLLDLKEYLWILLVFIPVWMFSMGSLGMYDTTTFCYIDRIIRNSLFATFISSLFLSSMIFFIRETMFSRTLFTIYVICTFSFLLSERLLYRIYIKRSSRHMNRSIRVVIAGSPHVARQFTNYIQKTNLNFNIIGYVRVDSKGVKSQKVLGHINDLEKIIKENVVDEVVFALPKNYMGEIEQYVLLCEKMGITVRMVLNLYDLKIAKTHLTCIGTLPTLTFHTVSLNRIQLFIKRLMDICGALVGLFLTGVISIFVAAAIKIDSPGPIIFAQDRVGLNGRVFKLYKFRSMCTDADNKKKELARMNEMGGGLMFKIKNDPRITRVGRFLRRTSLDEFPQFLNILKGDMSLVGTRPPTLDEVSKYAAYHRRRISIKPGLTGLWQVSGRSSITDFDEVVKLDTKYIDEWSILLDIKIIIKTIINVFKKDGAY